MVRLDPPQGEFKGLARQVAQMQGHMAPSYSILEEPWRPDKKINDEGSNGLVMFSFFGGILGRFLFRWILVER